MPRHAWFLEGGIAVSFQWAVFGHGQSFWQDSLGSFSWPFSTGLMGTLLTRIGCRQSVDPRGQHKWTLVIRWWCTGQFMLRPLALEASDHYSWLDRQSCTSGALRGHLPCPPSLRRTKVTPKHRARGARGRQPLTPHNGQRQIGNADKLTTCPFAVPSQIEIRIREWCMENQRQLEWNMLLFCQSPIDVISTSTIALSSVPVPTFSQKLASENRSNEKWNKGFLGSYWSTEQPQTPIQTSPLPLKNPFQVALHTHILTQSSLSLVFNDLNACCKENVFFAWSARLIHCHCTYSTQGTLWQVSFSAMSHFCPVLSATFFSLILFNRGLRRSKAALFPRIRHAALPCAQPIFRRWMEVLPEGFHTSIAPFDDWQNERRHDWKLVTTAIKMLLFPFHL